MNHSEAIFAQLLLRDPEVAPRELLAGVLEVEAAGIRGLELALETALEGRISPGALERARRGLGLVHHLDAESALLRLLVADKVVTREELAALIAESRAAGFAEWLAPLLVRRGKVSEQRIAWLFERRRFALAETREERVLECLERLAELPDDPSDVEIRAVFDLGTEPDPLLPVPAADPPRAAAPPPGPRTLLRVKDSLVHGYEIARRLDRGGMGVVYKARHIATGRIVALKILPLSIVPLARAERFRWECLATLRLDHEHLVKVFDFGACESYYWLALELLEGECLSTRLRTNRMPDREALPVVRQLAFAIEEIARVGLVHRDVKPGNVFINGDRVKLYDLGLAKFLGRDEDGPSTDRGGTPQYLSPEQAVARETVDLRSDLYALGVTLFHLVTAKLPFNDAPVAEIVRMQVEEEMPDPRTFDPLVSDETAAIVKRLTRKNREERYQSTGELVADIDRALVALDAVAAADAMDALRAA